MPVTDSERLMETHRATHSGLNSELNRSNSEHAGSEYRLCWLVLWHCSLNEQRVACTTSGRRNNLGRARSRQLLGLIDKSTIEVLGTSPQPAELITPSKPASVSKVVRPWVARIHGQTSIHRVVSGYSL